MTYKLFFAVMALAVVVACDVPPPPNPFGKCPVGVGGGSSKQHWDCVVLVRDSYSGQEVRLHLDGYGSNEVEATTSVAVQFPQAVTGSSYLYVSAACTPLGYDMLCELGGGPSYVFSGGATGEGGFPTVGTGFGGSSDVGTAVGGSASIGVGPTVTVGTGVGGG